MADILIPAPDTDVPALLATLQQEWDAMLQPHQLPGDWSPQQHDAYAARRSRLMSWLRTIRDTTTTLADVEPRIETRLSWRNGGLELLRKTLEQELLALPKRVYTKPDIGRKQNLLLSLRMVHYGDVDFGPTGCGWRLA